MAPPRAMHLLLALLAIGAATHATAQDTIASVATSAGLSTLVAAVSACPPILSAATNASTAVTVFAPTNEAFATALASLNMSAEALLGDQELLCNVLSYHILPTVVRSSEITADPMSVATLLAGANVTVRILNGIRVNTATVITADVMAGASIVHVIDQVLIPPSIMPRPTIASVASTVPDLSTLVAAVSACPPVLAAATNPDTAVTVFAPTNEAFATALVALNMTAEALLGNQDLLCSVLEYHIVPMVITAAQISSDPTSVATLLAGANITARVLNGAVRINTATVVMADVAAGLSIVHVIDQVLIPPSIMPRPTIASVASSVPDLSTLVAAVSACPPVLAAATNPDTAVTVFAPTNEAFAAALVALNMTAEALLGNQDLLCNVLEYHIVPMVITAAQVPTDPTAIATLLAGANITARVLNGAVRINTATVVMANVAAGLSIVHVIDQVLIPPSIMPRPTIASVASSVPDLSTLVAAVSACPPVLAAATNPDTAVTVFAPTNEAFATALAALNMTAEALLGNQDLLCNVLEYHIVPMIITAAQVPTDPTAIATLLAGANITARVLNGAVRINTATVVMANVAAGLSIVHVIDQVLIPPSIMPRPTIASVASSVPDLSTLVAAVSACPPVLAAATNPDTAVTVFAPTNEAFATALAALNMTAEALLGNQDLLCNVLEYHIVPMVITAAQVPTDPTAIATLLAGANITARVLNGAVRINTATVVMANVAAGLSIVHVIDQVLIPPSIMPRPTIASVASSVPDLSTLVAAVRSCPPILAAATNPDTAVTVFAPTNEAFATALAALNMTAEALLGNQELLCTVLEYHVVPSIITPAQIPYMPINVATLEGDNITAVRVLGGIRINDANVIIRSVPAGLSVVHVIDKVLLPPALRPMVTTTIASVASSVPDLSTLVAAVSACPPVLAAATNPNTTVTVLAPTNEAFVEVLATLNMTAEALLGNQELLCNVLSYHIIPQIVPSIAVTGTSMAIATLLPGANVTFMVSNGTVMINGYATVIMADVAAGNSLVHVINKVLLPPAPQPAPVTIASVASSVPQLSTLVSLVSGVPSLLAAVTDPNTSVTVFAPTNDAFEYAIGHITRELRITREQVLNDTNFIAAILSYHIAPPPLVYTANATVAAKRIFTLLPKADLHFRRTSKTYYVNSARIIAADVPAGMSVVQVVDKVLFPPNYRRYRTRSA